MKMKLLNGVAAAAFVSLMTFAAYAQGASTEITVMTTETNPDTQAVFDKLVSEFEDQNSDIDVNLQYVGFQDLQQKLMQAFAAGEPPQIFNVQSQYQVFELARQGLIRPVDDVIDFIGRDDYSERVLQSVSMDGKAYAVPFSVGVNVLWYRKDLYEANGLKEATTWDEFLKNVQTLDEAGKKAEGARTYGIAMSVADTWLTNDNTQNWMWSNGALVYDAEGNPTLTNPRSVETFEYLGKLAEYAPPGVNSYANNEMMNAFATGAVAHTEYPFRLLGYLKQSAPDLLDVSVPMLHPAGPGEGGHKSSLLYVKSWAVSEGAEYPEATAKFLKFMETGANKIEVMKTVPVHYWPPLKSIQTDPEFLDQPLLKTPAGKRSIAVLKEALKVGQFPVSESGTPVLKLGPVLQSRVLAQALEQIVVNDADPKSAVEDAASKLK